MDIQTIIVLGLIALALLWLVLYFVRSFLRKGAIGCGCDEKRKCEELPVHPDQS